MKQSQKKGFFSRVFSGNTVLTEDQESEARQQYAEITERAEKKRSDKKMDPSFTKMLPWVAFEFKLDEFHIALVDTIENMDGVSLFARDFEFNSEHFDPKNYYNVSTTRLSIILPEFGVDVTRKDEFHNTNMIKVRDDHRNSESPVPLLTLFMLMGNKNHATTQLLPKEEINDTNLTLQVSM